MAENESEEGEEKKSSKKLIIIIAIVLLLAGGGAGYYFMAGDTAPADGEDAEQIDEEDEEESEEGASTEVYFDMTKPLIVNFSKGTGARLIQVSVSLLVKGDEAVEALKKHEPMIRNNLLMTISAKGAGNLKTTEGKEALRAEMLKEVGKVLEKMLGKNELSNLFFTTFVMQ